MSHSGGKVTGVMTTKRKDIYIYNLNSDTKNLGVGTDSKLFYYKPKPMNKYQVKPCVCGSYRHANRHHLECLLNPRYDDKHGDVS